MTEDSPNIVIRPATDADSERVMGLVHRVLAEFGLPFEPDSKDSDLKNLEESYLRAGGRFEVIEDENGSLLGSYGIFPIDHEMCELRKMYFVPQIRGIGLGKRVLDRAVEHARRLGFTVMMLETHSALKRAERLYIRFGFAPIEVEKITARSDRRYVLKLT